MSDCTLCSGYRGDGETLQGKCDRLEESLSKALRRETEKKSRITALEAQLADKKAALAAQAEGHRNVLETLTRRHKKDLLGQSVRLDSSHMEVLRRVNEAHAAELAALRGEPTLIVKSYRKKPIEVEAIQYDGDNFNHIQEWSDGAVYDNFMPEPTDLRSSHLRIQTLEGIMIANVGDWIIKGVQGEFYPCKPGIFEETYSDA